MGGVLVVEDERIVSRDIQQRLADLGYRVAGSAVSGEEAARENAVFCLMCRVMISRAAAWAGLPGEARQVLSRAENGDGCRFELGLH